MIRQERSRSTAATTVAGRPLDGDRCELDPVTLLDVDPDAAFGPRAGRRSSIATSALRSCCAPIRRERDRPMSPDPPVSLWPDPDALGPVTDLYQLTMMAGYLAVGHGDRSARRSSCSSAGCPPNRAYLVFAGLEQAIGDLLRLAFSDEQVEAIRALAGLRARRSRRSSTACATLRFEGDVWASPRGRSSSPASRSIRVEAPPAAGAVGRDVPARVARLSDAGRLEGGADRRGGARAGRSTTSAPGAAHGPHAGLLAARASYLAGFAGTSHVEAARSARHPLRRARWPTPGSSRSTTSRGVRGLRPRSSPSASTLLVDTYDTPTGVRHAAAIEPPVQAIRIDSGDLDALAREARADPRRPRSTGGQDHRLGRPRRVVDRRLVAPGAPIDAFGVGTELVTSRDAPRCRWSTSSSSSTGQGGSS